MSTSPDSQQVETPGLATAITLLFLILLNLKHRETSNSFLRAHLKQPLIAGIISTSLFLLGSLFIILTGGYNSISIQFIIVLEAYTLIVVIPLLIPGLIGLIKSISGDTYRYPLIGKWLGMP